jgi:hypothetical protein
VISRTNKPIGAMDLNSKESLLSVKNFELELARIDFIRTKNAHGQTEDELNKQISEDRISSKTKAGAASEASPDGRVVRRRESETRDCADSPDSVRDEDSTLKKSSRLIGMTSPALRFRAADE